MSGVSVIPVAMVVEPGDGSDTPVTSVSIVFIDLSGGDQHSQYKIEFQRSQ